MTPHAAPGSRDEFFTLGATILAGALWALALLLWRS